jgi:hypothetical protein
MADLNMDAERAAFEGVMRAQAKPQLPDIFILRSGRYASRETQAKWEIWQEARRTAPVSAPMGEELPALSDEQIVITYRGMFPRGPYLITPDVHKFARAVEAKVIAPYAERIRQLERELATTAKNAAVRFDSAQRPQGVALLLKCSKCSADRSKEPRGNPQDCAMQGRAYIDGRTAGTAPDVGEEK